MPKSIRVGVIVTAGLLLFAGLAVAGSYAVRAGADEPAIPASKPSSDSVFAVAWLTSTSQPAQNDVDECNEYAVWMAEREAHLDRIAAEGGDRGVAPGGDRVEFGSLVSVGTLDGLSARYRDDPHATVAYRQCMVRRGYNVWG